MNYTKIRIVNFEEELRSFPLEQEIILESSVLLEDSLLKNKITLLREVPEYGLLNTADLYNYNIGYVKESFTTIPLLLRSYEKDSKFYVECKPERPLHPNSVYALFIDKDLSSEFISVDKLVSKGPSNLEILSLDNVLTITPLNPEDSITLEVISEPFISPTSNIVKFILKINDVTNKTFTINAKSDKNILSFLGLNVKVLDTAFGLGEKFQIKVQPSVAPLEHNYILTIKTALTADIKPIDNLVPSQKVTNEDILNFYTQTEVTTQTDSDTINFKDSSWMLKELRIEYLGYNKFILHLDKLEASDFKLDLIEFREFPAYNKYDLELLNLYSEEQSYNIITEILDNKTILFILEEIIL